VPTSVSAANSHYMWESKRWYQRAQVVVQADGYLTYQNNLEARKFALNDWETDHREQSNNRTQITIPQPPSLLSFNSTFSRLCLCHRLWVCPSSTFPLLIHSFIHSGYFYSASSSPLLLRGAPDYSIDTVSELTRRSATGNCEWRICPRSLHGG